MFFFSGLLLSIVGRDVASKYDAEIFLGSSIVFYCAISPLYFGAVKLQATESHLFTKYAS